MLLERWRNSTQLKCGTLGRRKTQNMFWGLIFNSNKKMSCYCCINSRVCFRWGRIPLCFSTNITKPALGLLPPQITSSASETTQNECALPPGPMPLPEGDKADTSQSPGRHSRDSLCQGICVSLIMTLFQRRSCLSCHSHAGLLISHSPPLASPSPLLSSPPLALLCFQKF